MRNFPLLVKTKQIGIATFNTTNAILHNTVEHGLSAHGLSDNTGQWTLHPWSLFYIHNAFYHGLSDNTGQPTFFRRSLEMSDKNIFAEKLVLMENIPRSKTLITTLCILGSM